MPLWIYSLVVILLTFTYFVFFSRTKLIIPRAYEIAFESGIWNADQKGSWIRRPPFVCSKTIFSKLKTKKSSGQSKNKFCFSHITRNKAYEAQMVYTQNIQSSLIVLGFSIVPKDNKLKWWHVSSPPPNFRGRRDLKVADQNNWGEELNKQLNWGGGRGGATRFHTSKTCWGKSFIEYKKMFFYVSDTKF